MKNVIYKITNIINGKIYIGSASFYNKRKGTHISLCRKELHKNPHLQNAWNLYGEKAFVFEIIEVVDIQNNLLKKEQFWLNKTQCYNREIGYNISKIAGSNLGNKLSEETKKKIGDFWRNKPKSEEHKKNFKKAQTEMNGKIVLVFNKNEELLHEFPSISECSKSLEISVSAISKFISRKLQGRFTKRKGKYIFKYKDIV